MKPADRLSTVHDMPLFRRAGMALRRWEVAALIVLFLLGYGTLLYKTEGVPYVLDNNESFSALVHGANLYHFGLSRSYGLTDEAYGADSAAHPYVYTHQGNFPRLFSFLLYAAGVRSVEGQIAVTTFTIGLGTILLIYLFFSRLAGRAYGGIVAFLFLSDYLLSVQWIVNTFKVWHGFLLFGLLSALQSYFAAPNRRALVCAALAAACIAYFDLLLAVFSFSAAGIFIAVEGIRSGFRKVRPAFLVLAGAGAFSVSLLILQLIAYYGLQGLKSDLYLTFMGRNYLATDPAVKAQWKSFFTDHRIVFWEMLVDSSVYTSAWALLRSIFIFGFSLFTPYFSFLVFALTAAKLGTIAVEQLAARRLPITPAWMRIAVEFLAWTAANAVFALVLLTSALYTANPTAGVAGYSISGYLVTGFAAAMALLMVALTRDPKRTDISRSLVLLAYFLFLAELLWNHADLYHVAQGDAQAIWAYVLKPWVGAGAHKMFAALTVVFGAISILRCGREGSTAPESNSAHFGILRFLAVSSAAFLAAYYFSPGYMQTINLQRFAPVLIFILAPFVAWALLYVYEEARRIARFSAALPRGPASRGSWMFVVPAPVAVLILMHAAMFWLWLQKSYLEIAPPDGAAPFQLMDKPPFRGASFVVNSYGAPVAAKTGSWAYVDQEFFQRARYALDEQGYRLDGSDLYKWFNDRNAPKYRNADYAFCFHTAPGFAYSLRALQVLRNLRPLNASIHDVFAPSDAQRDFMLARETEGTDFGFACALEPLVLAALEKHLDELKISLVARDRSLIHRWAIVKLESDFPPYLEPLDAPSGYVRVAVKHAASGCVAVPRYAFRQQQGKEEEGTRMELWLEGGARDARRLIYAGTPVTEMRLPPRSAGQLVVSVIPRTSTRSGRTFSSAPVRLSGC